MFSLGKLTVQIFALTATYLILLLPVTYAQTLSFQDKQPTDVMSNLISTIPTVLSDFVGLIKLVIENFLVKRSDNPIDMWDSEVLAND